MIPGERANELPPGLIFDFDGVIALSEPIHGRAFHDVSAHFSCPLPDRFVEEGVGTPDRELAGRLSQRWEGVVSAEQVLSAKQEFYRNRIEEEGVLVAGVDRALRYFSGRRPLAVATSSSREDLEPWFRKFELHSRFDVVLTIESVSRPKPDPEIYQIAASRLGVEVGRCVAFEDSIQGAKAARSAGTRVIGLTTTFSAAELAPLDGHMKDFSRLPELIERLNSLWTA